MHKHGDTLIEVALAIGIFSLVAIAVVSVVNGSTSDAQGALELTLTREEIDAQAEAIRFIQTSYIAGGSANVQGNTKYKKLWDDIKANAIDLNDNKLSEDVAKQILKYNPETCDDVYSNKDHSLYKQHAFVINTRNLGLKYSTDNGGQFEGGGIGDIIVRPPNNEAEGPVDNGKFATTPTFPRMVYGTTSDALYEANPSSNLLRAEGIYVVAVKDNKSTLVVGQTDKTSAYYDFYIRTCWFNAGASRPSSISTVIRLQDPDVISY